ncbi:hypothetical protein AB7M39_005547 [Bradyrhizobium diazoefficiens]
MADAFLGRDLVSEVAVEDVEQNAFAALQRRDAQFGLEFLAVTAAADQLAAAIERLTVSGIEEASETRLDPLALTCGDDEVDRIPAQRFVAAPAEQLFGPRAPVQDDAAVVGLDEGVERGLDDVAGQLLAFAQGLLGQPCLGHVAPDEEVALGLIGPVAEPGQPDLASVPVEAAGVGELRVPAAPECAHFLARLFEMGRVDEIGAAVADHVVGPVAENGLAARADLRDMALRVHDHDQVLRGVEKLPPLLELLL